MDSAFLITAFATLFVVIDPPGLAPLFVALTQGMPGSKRRAIALRACLLAGFLLALFAFLGEAVLGFIGISMPAFRIAGGILLFLTALEMLFQRRTRRRADQTEAEVEHEEDDPSVFPLAIPLIAGPGAITSVILLAGETGGPGEMAVLLGVLLVLLVMVLCTFLIAGLLERALGKTGLLVVTRLLGMLLAALSVQFVIDGLRAVALAG